MVYWVILVFLVVNSEKNLKSWRFEKFQNSKGVTWKKDIVIKMFEDFKAGWRGFLFF